MAPHTVLDRAPEPHAERSYEGPAPDIGVFGFGLRVSKHQTPRSKHPSTCAKTPHCGAPLHPSWPVLANSEPEMGEGVEGESRQGRGGKGGQRKFAEDARLWS